MNQLILNLINSFFKYLLYVLFFLCSYNCFSQSKLDKSKEEVKNGNPKDDEKGSDSYRTSNRENYGSNFLDNSFFDLLSNLAYVVIGYYDREDHLYNDVTHYPFKNGITGNYIKPDSVITQKLPRVDIENTFLFNRESIYGNHLKAKIRPWKYFYGKADYFQLFEYNQAKNNYSGLSLFAFNICYDRIRFERFNLGWNMGVNYMASGVNKAGFAFGLNTDIFPMNKISIHSAVCWSKVNGVAVNQLEAEGAYHINKWLLNIGYTRLKIGTPVYDFLSIGTGIFL